MFPATQIIISGHLVNKVEYSLTTRNNWHLIYLMLMLMLNVPHTT